MRILRARAAMTPLLGLVVMTALGTGAPAWAAQPEPSPGQMEHGGMMSPGQMGKGGMMTPEQMGQSGMMGGRGMMGPGMMGGHMMGPGMMGGSPQDRPWLTIMLDQRQELGLSAEQVGKLFDLREQFQGVAQERTQAIAKAEEELGAILGPQPVDLAAAETKLKAVEGMRTELRLARLKTIEEGKQLLTADQQKKLVQVAEQLRPMTGMGQMGPGAR